MEGKAEATGETLPPPPPEARRAFDFDDLTFTVADRATREPKHLVAGVSGSVRGGEIMAVLGPSGSGKSTLVAMLTLRTATGAASGAARFRRSCFVVEQRDELWPYLTCRESMAYAAALYGAPGRDPDAHLDRLGLASCADTLVGTHFQPGLSGGQKRRLSIALALVKRAKCLLLDEPTSGLDAAAAYNVVTFLRELAKADKLYVLAVCLRRQCLLIRRDPILLVVRAVALFAGNLYFSIVYIQARRRHQDQVSVLVAYATNMEMGYVRTEVTNGLLRAGPYLLSKALLEIPLMILLAFAALGVPGFLVLDFGNFGSSMVVWALHQYACETTAACCACLGHPLLAMAAYMTIWYCDLLYCGVWVPRDDMVWPLRAFHYPSPTTYASASSSGAT
ncbi:ATPase [Aureococcus anophagefferens]|nr:ATPase [Aureococcus anophagefferens]